MHREINVEAPTEQKTVNKEDTSFSKQHHYLTSVRFSSPEKLRKPFLREARIFCSAAKSSAYDMTSPPPNQNWILRPYIRAQKMYVHDLDVPYS